MSGISPELGKWKNHARELQATALLRVAEQGFEVESEAKSDQFRRLRYLMTTPPIMLPSLFDYFQETADDFYKEAATALKMGATQAVVLGIFKMLTQACNETTLEPREVVIDSLKIKKTPPTEVAFKGNTALVDQATTEGQKDAIKKILQLTQGETPLMRYKKDLIENRLQPDLAKAGHSFVSLPTRIEGVDLRLQYAEAEQIPKLSFIVRPLQ